ncbi:calcium-dependent phosphotriesterase [Glonium stellatum]|uniref:Calcium-dependent phosphotriesterase n=1 Tax=Glonium stellatum TaxID=574774 RepID=A0A8E2EVC3_9PEZI|nr:calcium-dependent phosphotriesterase [Glonium stellatum]
MADMPSTFTIHDSSFHKIIGSTPQVDLLLENDKYPFAHEAGVFIPSTNEVFITSNRFVDASGQPKIQISKVILGDGSKPAICETIQSDKIRMANGGVNYDDGILFCAQGSMRSPSGLYKMSRLPPYESTLLVADFYGRPFNSVNDVVVHSDGSIWFTDPIYGFEQGYRPKPQLPNQVYRYEPQAGSIRAVADGFGRPNGICFSPDEKIVYITDTDWIHGDGTVDGMRASTIYAFDICYYSGQPFLTNRRIFAMADTGIPDGIKCDTDGNVYSGCGDGVNVWSPGGVLLGKIVVEGGVANFCFGKKGELFMLNENRMWRAQLADSVRGALLRI